MRRKPAEGGIIRPSIDFYSNGWAPPINQGIPGPAADDTHIINQVARTFCYLRKLANSARWRHPLALPRVDFFRRKLTSSFEAVNVFDALPPLSHSPPVQNSTYREEYASMINDNESESGLTPADLQDMKTYGIIRVPTEYFVYRSYRYTNLSDALTQARLVSRTAD